MFSSSGKKIGRYVSVRISAWFAAIYAASFLAFYLAVYFVLASSLRRADLAVIGEKTHQFSEEYKEHGLREVVKASAARRNGALLVRVADPKNHTLFFSAPENWPKETQSRLESATGETRWIRDRFFDVESRELPDGNLLQIGRSAEHRIAFLKHFRRVCIELIFPLVLLGIGGGVLFAHRALRPIRTLAATIHGIISTGKIDERIAPTQGGGDLRELVASFNLMLERIDGLMRALKGTLDNVAHDLRTPLTRLRGTAELALQHPENVEAARNALADCVEESERIVTLLNAIMDISEVETGAMKLDIKNLNVRRLAESVTELYQDVADEKQIALTVIISDELTVLADENRMRQAMANLVDNAIKYSPEGGLVEVRAERQDNEIVLSVKDNGAGIAPDDLPKVWDRLYRSDESRSQRGLGLGLSLVKAIVKAHKGRVQLDSEPGMGARVALYFAARPSA
ncbi:MAG: HAMP domain-containing histidine kinase [Verrucomicrobiota bacterium]|nr:HAMP domain-containing histidine kinase [Verrucomicrobiota bacterium]